MSDSAAAPDPVRDLIPAIDRAEEGLQSLAADAAKSERAELMGILAAAIAHEVRNIVTPIGSSAELALENPDDPGLARRALQRAVSGTRRAAAVVEAVLDCAAGKVGWVKCDVAQAVEGALEVLGEEWKRSGAKVEVRVEAGCEAGISGVCLEQVFVNLLLNAAAAMGKRGGRVVVRGVTCWNDQSGPRVMIEVEDEGRGIGGKDVSMIFDAFMSGEGQRGKGLGLTICRHLVEAVGGKMDVRSAVSVGTTFVIELPVAERRMEMGRRVG